MICANTKNLIRLRAIASQLLREISTRWLIPVRTPLAQVAMSLNFPSQAQPSHSLEDLRRKQLTREVEYLHQENIHLSILKRHPLGRSAQVEKMLSNAVSKTPLAILVQELMTQFMFHTLPNLRHLPWLTNRVRALQLTIRCLPRPRSEMFRERNLSNNPNTRGCQVLNITFLPISTSLILIQISDTNRRELRRPNSHSA